MSDTTADVHESYAFACMRCGHGWEQTYAIEHRIDPTTGREHAVYYADGERVPSPLTRPTCFNCGGHLVRTLRAGQVTAANDRLRSVPTARGTLPEPSVAGPPVSAAAGERVGRTSWHLSDLFHRRSA
ncbi:hypothetical protein [Streptomyces sp. NPDC060194]|uniref:hypothetical protein n=1 Tax=Streptomyces sp. NPDC060194 TaxID=3347069 RepID=UPI00365251EF